MTYTSKLPFALFFLSKFAWTAAQQDSSNEVVSIPYELTYLLPNGFAGNSNYTFANGTHTSNNTINDLLAKANVAPFISYDQAFLDILGSSPEIKLVAERDDGSDFAYEMGVWVPSRSEVWFTSSVSAIEHHPATLFALNLNTNEVGVVNASQPIIDPNGGYYFEGKVYIATYPNNETYSGGIVSVDAQTLEVETVVNSYFGLRFNGIDDIAWAKRNGNSYMFFTDLDFAYLGYPTGLPPLQLPDGVWRWDPQEGVLLPAISRNEVNPNGVRVSPDQKTLYVTDSSGIYNKPGPYNPQILPGAANWYGNYVYKWDLDKDMFPVNRKVFAVARDGIADGIHVDDAGNVWTGEYEGVVVRNPAGKIIGLFNSGYFLSDQDAATQLPFANFALANDTLIYNAINRLYTVKLGKTIVASNSSIVN